jgi:hypothetical protein
MAMASLRDGSGALDTLTEMGKKEEVVARKRKEAS